MPTQLIRNSIRVITLDEPWDNCCICNAETRMDYGLALYEDEIVPDDDPGEWGGFTACKRCFYLVSGIQLHQKGRIPISDVIAILKEADNDANQT